MSDVAYIVNAIKELGREWDADCKEAYDLGFFDTDRDTWIAEGLHRVFYPEIGVTTTQLNNALDDINYIAQEADRHEFGLPLYDHWPDYMRRSLITHLNLKAKE